MSALFRNAQPARPAEIIGVGFLLFKVMFGLMQFVTVDVRYSIGDDMAVQVVLVLVDADQALEAVEEFASKLPADIKALCCGDLFIFVKADDVVRIHPARVFSPLLLLFQEAPVHTVSVNTLRAVGAGDIDITLL